MNFLNVNLSLLLFSSITSCYSIVTTKITASYWRATFSSPPLNLEDTDFFLDFYALVDQISSDSDVKVVVFDSAVQDFWIAHFDILHDIPSNLTRDSGAYWGNITRLANLPVVTVAAVRGIASGGGAELAMAMDVSFASDKAVFRHPEVGIGLVPGAGGLVLLPAKVGRSRALEIVIGAEDFDGITAAQYGWINRAIPDDQFEYFVDKFARRVAAFDTFAISTAKQLINKNTGFPTVAAWEESWDAFQACIKQPLFQARFPALIKAGVQVNVTFERNMAEELLRFTGSGPFDV